MNPLRKLATPLCAIVVSWAVHAHAAPYTPDLGASSDITLTLANGAGYYEAKSRWLRDGLYAPGEVVSLQWSQSHNAGDTVVSGATGSSATANFDLLSLRADTSIEGRATAGARAHATAKATAIDTIDVASDTLPFGQTVTIQVIQDVQLKPYAQALGDGSVHHTYSATQVLQRLPGAATPRTITRWCDASATRTDCDKPMPPSGRMTVKRSIEVTIGSVLGWSLEFQVTTDSDLGMWSIGSFTGSALSSVGGVSDDFATLKTRFVAPAGVTLTGRSGHVYSAL